MEKLFNNFDLQLFAGEDAEPAGDEGQSLTVDEGTGQGTEGAAGEPADEDTGGGSDEGKTATPDEKENQEPDIHQRYTELEKNYKRLERKFTRTAQQQKELEPAVNLYRFIAERPELAQQVNRLLEQHAGVPPAGGQPMMPEINLSAEFKTARELAANPTFTRHEQEIEDWAEENGYLFETPSQQKAVFLLWKGENADRLIQEARLEGAKKAVQTSQAKAKAGLARAGGTGQPPPPDFRKMSDEEVLAHLGLKLWEE